MPSMRSWPTFKITLYPSGIVNVILWMMVIQFFSSNLKNWTMSTLSWTWRRNQFIWRLGSGRLMPGVGGWSGILFLGGEIVLRPMGGVGWVFLCLTGKHFNKCYKKAVFMKNNYIWVYIKYELEEGCIFFSSRQPNFPNTPPTSIKWLLPNM